MTYLLDTDILSNLMRRVPESSLISRLARVSSEEQFTSSVTLGELIYGALRSERADLLLGRIETVVPTDLPVLPFDAAAARKYGEVRADLERKGTPIGDADLRIAAIALSRRLTVVTANERHFRRVPDLAVENWLEG